MNKLVPTGSSAEPRPSPALSGSVGDFQRIDHPNVLDRWNPHQAWFDARLACRVDPYCKAILSQSGPKAQAAYRDGSLIEGINFASQDYLSLSSHPALIEAMVTAARDHGIHSAGSAALMGNTLLSLQLERELADFLAVEDCTLFSTGWGAGYGIIRGLVRPEDHVVIDVLAHACLHEGARSATRNLSLVPHLSLDGVKRRLKRIRSKDTRCGIVVVTESLFSMDSDVPDMLAMQALCREYDASLIVDVAHDLGAIGPSGHGYLGLQDALGKVDIVMGSFSKTFASNGGFVASNHPALKLALRSSCPTQTFTNAISPIASAIVLKAFEIVRSAEGQARRERLIANVDRLRRGLADAGFELLGQPSAIVPVVIGDVATSRLMTAHAIANGGLVNLVEYPAVARNSCRWRLQVMADHSDEDIDSFVRIAVAARDSVGNAASAFPVSAAG